MFKVAVSWRVFLRDGRRGRAVGTNHAQRDSGPVDPCRSSVCCLGSKCMGVWLYSFMRLYRRILMGIISGENVNCVMKIGPFRTTYQTPGANGRRDRPAVRRRPCWATTVTRKWTWTMGRTVAWKWARTRTWMAMHHRPDLPTNNLVHPRVVLRRRRPPSQRLLPTLPT